MRIVPARDEGEGPAVLPVFGGDPRAPLDVGTERWGKRAFRASLKANTAAVEARLGAGTPAGQFAQLSVVQIAHCDLWRASGVELRAAAGVGIGEVSAAYAVGALSREDALEVACAVARIQAARFAGTHVFAIQAESALAKRLCRTAPVRLEFAGSTGLASSLVVAPAGEADGAREHLAQRTAIEREHEIADPFPGEPPAPRTELKDVLSRAGFGRLYSAAAGGEIPPGTTLDAVHWDWVARRPFYLDEALAAARADGFATMLGVPGEQSADRATVRTLRRSAWPGANHADAGAGSPPVSAPVQPVDGAGTWVVLGHDEVRSALTQPDVFSSSVWAQFDSSLLSLDPPEHTVPRKAVAPFLSRTATEALGETADLVARELVGRQADRVEFDAVADLADPLVEAVIGRLLGLDAAVVRDLAASIKDGGQEPDLTRVQPALEDLPEPPALLEALAGSGAIDAPHAMRLLRFLWLAGVVTSRRALPRAILVLWEHPEIRARIAADPSLMPRFFDEVLRLYPPEQLLMRTTTRDTTLGGVEVPAGAVLQFSLAAANREPSRFPEPERVRLDRRPGHLAFGAGPHRCPGAGIARTTSMAGLTALVAAMPDFEVVHPPCMRRDVGVFGGDYGASVLEELIVAPMTA